MDKQNDTSARGVEPLTTQRVRELKREAYEKAVEAMTGYKFTMAGYHAAIWIYLNQIDPDKEANPFRPWVDCARNMQRRDQNQLDILGNEGSPAPPPATERVKP